VTDYQMYTEAGNEAVQRWVIEPTIEVIDSGPTEKNPERNIRKRAEIQLRHGMEHVAAIGHREVFDTDVRESIYYEIGQALVERGVLRETDDLFNWEVG
jgi:hypothetical protein